MRRFDYSFLNNGLLPANLVNLTSSIASLKTMAGVRKEEYAKVFTELEAVAKIQSIKSSNAIEGIVTSDERIAAIVNQNRKYCIRLDSMVKEFIVLGIYKRSK